MSSPLAGLLPDCRDHVVQYLTLSECLLKYARCSKASLQDVVPDLRRRRKQQFLHRRAYQLENPSKLRVLVEDETEQDAIISTTLESAGQWHVLPSLNERIQHLCRKCPSSHPFDNDLSELVLDLQQKDIAMEAKQEEDFDSILCLVRKLTNAHRLHASLLSRCTMQSKPTIRDRGFRANAHPEDDPSSLTTTLENYVFDVLAVYYLLGHSIAGLAEGGPTQGQWVQHLIDQIKSCSTDARHWYQLWVYFHSTLLRSFPFTRDQMDILGLLPCGITGRTEPEQVDYLHPHYPFLGTGTSVVEGATHLVETFQAYMIRPSVPRTVHRTTTNEFGPLGPAFRGRDRVRSIVMRPEWLVHRLESPAFWIPKTWLLIEQQRHAILHNRSFHEWFTGGDHVVQWMVELQQECRKSQPMTVVPPLVTIASITNAA